MLLAACYDQSTAETFKGRWHRLRRRLKFQTWQVVLAAGARLGVVGAARCCWCSSSWRNGGQAWLPPWWVYPILLLAGVGPVALAKPGRTSGWPAASCSRMRVGIHETNPLRQVLMQFPPAELSGQPLPNKDSTDDRYELLLKLQGLLQTLGHSGIIVLVDRVDEPHLVNGSAELMKALLWPMLDNKFLKHPGLGLKLMLPIELTRFIEREERDFYQRARLDKQNMIPSFEWTGEALYDVATARVRGLRQARRASPALTDLFEPGVSQPRLIEAFRTLRVPRRLFKFLYHLIAAHCNAHTDQTPELEDLADAVRIDAGPLAARSGRLRPGRGGGVGELVKVSNRSDPFLPMTENTMAPIRIFETAPQTKTCSQCGQDAPMGVLTLRDRRVEMHVPLCIAHYDLWFKSLWYAQSTPAGASCRQECGFVRCDIIAVIHGRRHAEALVCLREMNGDRKISIPIGWPERYVLIWTLKREQLCRPYTHHAMASMIRQLGGIPTHGKIDVVDYASPPPFLHAKIVIQHANSDIAVDMRPSDMFILAVILDVPIYVESSILEEWGRTQKLGPDMGISRKETRDGDLL